MKKKIISAELVLQAKRLMDETECRSDCFVAPDFVLLEFFKISRSNLAKIKKANKAFHRANPKLTMIR